MLFRGRSSPPRRRSSTSPTTTASSAAAVREGRREFLRQFRSAARPEMQRRAAPTRRDPATFARCKLDLGERDAQHGGLTRCTATCSRLRREDPVFSRPARRPACDGAVLADERVRAALLRGRRATTGCCSSTSAATSICEPAPEPLLAPPAGRAWQLLWSSEDPRYGGDGTPRRTPRDHRIGAGARLRGRHARLLAGAADTRDPARSRADDVLPRHAATS